LDHLISPGRLLREILRNKKNHYSLYLYRDRQSHLFKVKKHLISGFFPDNQWWQIFSSSTPIPHYQSEYTSGQNWIKAGSYWIEFHMPFI